MDPQFVFWFVIFAPLITLLSAAAFMWLGVALGARLK